MARLGREFEQEARRALLDDAESVLVGRENNLAFRFAQQAHERLREYGQRYDMNVEPIIDSLKLGDVQRRAGRVTVRLEWTHEAAGYFEMGTSPHTIHGNPVLSFVWEDPPAWVREAFNQARSEGGQFKSGWRVFFRSVDHPGMPASRYIRDTLEWLRREVAA